MYIKISKGLFEQNKAFFEKIGLRDHAFFHRSTTTIDLRKVRRDTVSAIRKICEKSSGLYGAKAIIKDIDAWNSALSSDGDTGKTCRGASQFCSMLTLMMSRTPNKWLFSTEDDEPSPYYVESIEFSPGERSSYGSEAKQPFTTVSLYWTDIGRLRARSITVGDSDCRGKTVSDILMEEGYVIENQDLVERYESDYRKLSYLVGKIGTQMLACGSGDPNVTSFDKSDGDSRWYYKADKIDIGSHDMPSRVVIDETFEGDCERGSSKNRPSHSFWDKYRTEAHESSEEEIVSEEPDEDGEDGEISEIARVPMHTRVVVFDFQKHQRFAVHVSCLSEYQYRGDVGQRLIIPEDHRKLINMLVAGNGIFTDVVSGKGGGATILSAGPPGTGKTLTAEVYSETSKRPLYSVQCSQLGLNINDLEQRLGWAFQRAKRWNAILLLDEADVYVRARGDDLEQNAIVGVFLRMLEYYDGVLFMTTNRSDLVDDAIASRCIARIDYSVPSKDLITRIWKVLGEVSGSKISDKLISDLVDRFVGISGRDAKNLLKLAAIAASSAGEELAIEHFEFASKFKPSVDASKSSASA